MYQPTKEELLYFYELIRRDGDYELQDRHGINRTSLMNSIDASLDLKLKSILED